MVIFQKPLKMDITVVLRYKEKKAICWDTNTVGDWEERTCLTGRAMIKRWQGRSASIELMRGGSSPIFCIFRCIAHIKDEPVHHYPIWFFHQRLGQTICHDALMVPQRLVTSRGNCSKGVEGFIDIEVWMSNELMYCFFCVVVMPLASFCLRR